MTDQEQADKEPAPPGAVARHYKHLLKARESSPLGLEGFGGFESAQDAEPDLSAPAVKDRLNSTRAQLRRVIKEHLGDDPKLYEIAERLLAQGGEALRALEAEDDDRLAQPEVLGGLEAIVRTDGSRPSFMVRNGTVDLATSPAGMWSPLLTVSADLLRDTLECVGRVDVPVSKQGFVGTGFLINENLILTNRHVLQSAAVQLADGTWKFKPGAAIDFGHEFRARESVRRRPLWRVVFCGPKRIEPPMDHTKLDLALIELEPADAASMPPMVLSVDVAEDWAQPDLTVYTVGYPGSPAVGSVHPNLLEELFQVTFGHKRLAPGCLMTARAKVHTWTLAHDATTLVGNSGSLVLVVGREHTAAGLHYGGDSDEPRENWGHVLGSVLGETDGRSDATLRQHFEHYGVDIIDRVNS